MRLSDRPARRFVSKLTRSLLVTAIKHLRRVHRMHYKGKA
ncbi:hypothetical protein XHC_0365 [Xanthomonas hortorum pv. carotae str. M081]|nr:hypothetical protein XHC_0365 [Xanthomonas hortorum pv. carotae str. M081]